jgi:hypothetical protein
MRWSIFAILLIITTFSLGVAVGAPRPSPPSVTVYLVGTVGGVLTIFKVYQSWEDCRVALEKARSIWGMTDRSVAASLRCTTTPYGP